MFFISPQYKFMEKSLVTWSRDYMFHIPLIIMVAAILNPYWLVCIYLTVLCSVYLHRSQCVLTVYTKRGDKVTVVESFKTTSPITSQSLIQINHVSIGSHSQQKWRPRCWLRCWPSTFLMQWLTIWQRTITSCTRIPGKSRRSSGCRWCCMEEETWTSPGKREISSDAKFWRVVSGTGYKLELRLESRPKRNTPLYIGVILENLAGLWELVNSFIWNKSLFGECEVILFAETTESRNDGWLGSAMDINEGKNTTVVSTWWFI